MDAPGDGPSGSDVPSSVGPLSPDLQDAPQVSDRFHNDPPPTELNQSNREQDDEDVFPRIQRRRLKRHRSPVHSGSESERDEDSPRPRRRIRSARDFMDMDAALSGSDSGDEDEDLEDESEDDGFVVSDHESVPGESDHDEELSQEQVSEPRQSQSETQQQYQHRDDMDSVSDRFGQVLSQPEQQQNQPRAGPSVESLAVPFIAPPYRPLSPPSRPSHQTSQQQAQVIDQYHGLEQFLRAHRTFDTTEATHTSFAGGKYKIPSTLRRQLFSLVATALRQGKDVFLNELIGAHPFRFYFDCDMTDRDLKTLEKFVQLSSSVDFSQTLRIFIDEAVEDLAGRHVSYVSKRRSYKIHFHYPTFICTADVAASIVTLVRDRLRETYLHALREAGVDENPLSDDDWNRMFDTGVYNTGLRMLGSRKADSIEVYSLLDPDTWEPIEMPTAEQINLASIHPDLEDPVERGQYDQLDTEVHRFGGLRGHATSLIEVRANGYPYKVVSDATPEQTKALVEYLDWLKVTDASCQHRDMRVAKIQTTQFGGFWITVRDRLCPFIDTRLRPNGQHRRATNYLYYHVRAKGTRLHCFNQECKGKAFPDDRMLPLSEPLRELVFPMGGGQQGALPSLTIRDQDGEELSEDQLTERLRNLRLRFNMEENGNQLYRLIEDSLSMTDFSVARVVYHVFRDIYRVDDSKGSNWYYFDGNRWTQTGWDIRVLISTYLVQVYRLWKTKRIEMGTRPWTELDEEGFQKLLRSLEKHGFKQSVVAEAATLFSGAFPNFTDLLDTNPNLIATPNGVIDFETFQFRPGKPDDYISLSTNVELREFDDDDPLVLEIESFFRDLFQDEETRKWIFGVLSRSLVGPRDEALFLLTGSGSNGKSRLVTLIQRTLGDYAGDLPISYITQKRAHSSAASPEIMCTKGRRFIASAEPDSGQSESTLNMGIVKNVTGGDYITARALYQNQTRFRPQFSLFVCTNDAPLVSDTSEGTWRRIRFVEFMTRFVDGVPVHPHEKTKDPTIPEKTKKWPEAFLFMLVKEFMLHRGTPLPHCPAVIASNDEYRRECDNFTLFMDRHLDSVSTAQTTIDAIIDIYNDFCTYEGIKSVGRTHAIKRRLLHYGRPVYNDGRLYYKVVIKQTVDEYNKSRNNQQQQEQEQQGQEN